MTDGDHAAEVDAFLASRQGLIFVGVVAPDRLQGVAEALRRLGAGWLTLSHCDASPAFVAASRPFEGVDVEPTSGAEAGHIFRSLASQGEDERAAWCGAWER